MERRQQSTTRLYGSEVSGATQRHALTNGEIPVAVYGLGKMGLPLAAVLSEVTTNVTGVDIDPAVVKAVSNGECPVQGEPGLMTAIENAVDEGWLTATDRSVEAATDARVHVVIVPTLLTENKEPDLSALSAAITDIAAGLSPGDLVCIESTVPPGTCRDVIEPELVGESGLDSDAFGLAFCPERTSSGRALADIRGEYPKVVGGSDPESTRAATILYDEVTDNDVIPVSDTTTAECVKLFEGLYRDVNIALANEIARLGEEFSVDVHEAIDVASRTPYCDIHSPGPGVGGHCIPYYPYFVIKNTEQKLPLLQEARGVNEGMPAYTVNILQQKLSNRGITLNDASVAILGITYRAGVDETRAAPAFPIAAILSDLGTTVYAADPICTDTEDIAAEHVTIDLLPALDLDAAVVVTAHEEFHTIGWDEIDDDVFILDGRQLFDNCDLSQEVYQLGDGSQNYPNIPQEVPSR